MFRLSNTIKQVGIFTTLLLAFFVLQGCDTATSDVLLSSDTSTLSESTDDYIAAAPGSPILRRNVDTASSILAGPSRPAQTILTTLGVIAGGDPLTSGCITINRITGGVTIDLTGSNVSNLYELYWVAPSATSLATDAIYMGNIVTDATGAATGEVLRDIVTFADIASGTPVNVNARKIAGGYPANTRGWFVFYSRGPYPASGSGTLPNPAVNLTPTSGDSTSYTQYISTNIK